MNGVVKVIIIIFIVVIGLAAFVPPDALLDIIIGPSFCELVTDCYDPREAFLVDSQGIIQTWLKILFILSTGTTAYLWIKKNPPNK